MGGAADAEAEDAARGVPRDVPGEDVAVEGAGEGDAAADVGDAGEAALVAGALAAPLEGVDVPHVQLAVHAGGEQDVEGRDG